jgi:hypothetical protein
VAALPFIASDDAALGVAWAQRTSDVRALWGVAGYLALALPIYVTGWLALVMLPLGFAAWGFLLSGIQPGGQPRPWNRAARLSPVSA